MIVFCVILTLACSLRACHMSLTRNHIFIREIGHFLKFWNAPCFTREISKFQKSDLGKFIPNFPLKHVITSTYFKKYALYLGKFWSRVWSVPGPLFRLPLIAKRCTGDEVGKKQMRIKREENNSNTLFIHSVSQSVSLGLL